MLSEFLRIGTFSLSGYSFFYGLALLVGGLTIFLLASRERLDRLETINYLLFGVIVSVLSAKLFGVVVFLWRASSYEILSLRMLWHQFLQGGFFFGGLIAGLLYAVFYLRRYFQAAFWTMLDITALGVSLGHAIGRVGCFLGGCCYGRPTSLPWGVRFKNLGPFPHPFEETPIHPTQLYEAVLDLINFFILLFLWRRRKQDGRVTAFYLINYGIIRFLIEYLRNDDSRGYIVRGASPLASLSVPQLLSVGLIVGGVLILKKRRARSSSSIVPSS